MARKLLNLTRDQLALFLTDHEQIRQFENLFAAANNPQLAGGGAGSIPYQSSAGVTALLPIGVYEQVLQVNLAADAPEWVSSTGSGNVVRSIGPTLSNPNINNPTITNGRATELDYVGFDNTPTLGTITPGTVYWDDGNGTLNLNLKGGNVDCLIGEQEYARVYNDTASTLTKGQVVYISGAQGNRVAVKLAQADSDVNSAHTIGFVAETITAGGEGWAQISGPIYKLNTLGTTAGDTVYLSPTTPGGWTTTKPVAPDHLVILGFIERVHASVGSIFIKVDNGYELDELHNVKITSVANNDILQYDSTGPFWENAPTTGSGNVVRQTSPTFLTSIFSPTVIGGTGTTSTLQLRATSGIGALGSDIVFQVGTNGGTEAARILQSGFCGIGTSSPSAPLTVRNLNITNGEILTLQTNAGSSGVRIRFQQNFVGTVWTPALIQAQDQSGFGGNLRFYTNSGGITDANLFERLTILSNGNIGINITAPAARLDVNGTAQVRGTGDLFVIGSGLIGYGTGSGGSVTQTTSRTQGVTLNKTNGAITLVSAAGTTAWQSFTVTNSTVSATDVVKVCQKSGTDLYMIHVTNVAAGSFQITFATTGGTTTEQPVFNFAVINAVTA